MSDAEIHDKLFEGLVVQKEKMKELKNFKDRQHHFGCLFLNFGEVCF